MIAAKHVIKTFDGFRALDGLTMEVPKGAIYGLVGPNGAGKSTTIRTLMGLIRPTGGNAAIFGLDCQTQASEIARNVGYLPSEDSYYENMKVHQLLQYTADLYGMDCWSKANDLAARLDLDLYRKISDLSLENRKKTGIVSALITGPKLVIMDEPTSGLDPLIQQAFYEVLEEENRRGTTIFLSSHVLSEVQRLCDRVAILKNGQLVGIQSIKELRESGYKKVSVTAKPAIPNGFFDLAGIADYKESSDHLSASFMYNGNITSVMEKLHSLPLQDVFLEEPSLEEIFLHYYE